MSDEPFVVNLDEATWMAHPTAGTFCSFESQGARFADFGINVHVLQPGEPNALYHEESAQEDFLVLHGECLLIVNGEERALRAWDFVHCPAGTEHVFVGAGDGPCAVLMVGARRPGATVRYPVNELAARHGASASEATDDAAAAYASWSKEFTRVRLSWPLSP
jgi:uncharacterized cupin superfamily protein